MTTMLHFLLKAMFLVSSACALYFPNAAVLTQRDVGRQLSLNMSGTFLAYAAYDNQSVGDQSYVQRVRIVSSGNSTTLFNLSSQIDPTGLLYPANLSTPITISNDNNDPYFNTTDFVLYFVQFNVTTPFPVYTLQSSSINAVANFAVHGVTILNAKPSLLASTFSLRGIPSVRIASCGYETANIEDYAILDITSQRQSLSFYILNGPIATFFDPKATPPPPSAPSTPSTNISFSFSLIELTSLDRKIPPGAAFSITSAGFATVNSSYNVDRGLTLKQNFDFGKDTLTQIVIDASDFRSGEKIRFIASGSKNSLDLSLNSSSSMYEPDVSSSTIALSVTTDDANHAPRFRIKVVSGASKTGLTKFILALFIVIVFY